MGILLRWAESRPLGLLRAQTAAVAARAATPTAPMRRGRDKPPLTCWDAPPVRRRRDGRDAAPHRYGLFGSAPKAYSAKSASGS
ncbi:hypothetical protein Sgou_10870 [Streptomyces gougerotii]|uniref:Uncharacterized protein n=1 Tax=Streptomyces gougerotii TaxID=53448 RepID=A0ABQ1D1H4_9ACTN|nr:hypothetical protein Sgou_10870 [Streptomyces gougerotii]